jgi:hypothetical protein
VRYKTAKKILSGLFGVITPFMQALGSVFPIANAIVVAGYAFTTKEDVAEVVESFIIGLFIGELIKLAIKFVKP